MTKIYTVGETPSKNSYVRSMGFEYPLIFPKAYRLEFMRFRDKLEKDIGEYCTNTYFQPGCGLKTKWYMTEDPKLLRWYAGPRKWSHANLWSGDNWMVFRTRADRTWAQVFIGH
jgi:hypothetical protein